METTSVQSQKTPFRTAFNCNTTTGLKNLDPTTNDLIRRTLMVAGILLCLPTKIRPTLLTRALLPINSLSTLTKVPITLGVGTALEWELMP